MKCHLGNLFVRLGSAPTEEANFLSFERREGTCLIRVAACAEQFDASLGFYMEVSSGMPAVSDSCWVELQRRTKKRLPSEISKGIGMVGYTRKGALYGNVGSYEIMTVINEFWLSDRFRIIGMSKLTDATAVEIATRLDQPLTEIGDKLSPSVIFVLEKQYFVDEPFLELLVNKRILNSTHELISRAAARLRRPLLEVGPRAWPPR